MVASETGKITRQVDCCQHCCGCGTFSVTSLPPTSSSSPLLSTATSPISHNLSTSYGPDEFHPMFARVMKFLSSNPTPPSSPHGMPTFTLQVTAQAVPLPSRVPNPPITLRLCFFEQHSQLPHLANSMLSQGKEGSAEVCHSREAAVTQYQSNAADLLNPERALKDVRQLLTSLADCNGSPWVLMPFTLFITDAAARIQRYLNGCLRSESLGLDRIICHLEVTARYSKHK